MERKTFEAEIKSYDEKTLEVEHFISTERRDRGRDVMRADGMRVTGKPVVLLIHGMTSIGSEPIAKPLWIRKDEFRGRPGILAKTKFFPDETGRRLFEKTTKGFMPNWSIGYRVIRSEEKRDETGPYRDVTEWELLEYSLVGVPMQPDAQTLAFKIESESILDALTKRVARILWLRGKIR
jgi:HK97 family phage prohead protease